MINFDFYPHVIFPLTSSSTPVSYTLSTSISYSCRCLPLFYTLVDAYLYFILFSLPISIFGTLVDAYLYFILFSLPITLWYSCRCLPLFYTSLLNSISFSHYPILYVNVSYPLIPALNFKFCFFLIFTHSDVRAHELIFTYLVFQNLDVADEK